MLVFYTLKIFDPFVLYQALTVILGIIEVMSIALFFYNILQPFYQTEPVDIH